MLKHVSSFSFVLLLGTSCGIDQPPPVDSNQEVEAAEATKQNPALALAGELTEVQAKGLQELLSSSRYDDAASLLNDVIEGAPDNELAKVLLLASYILNGDNATAISWMSKHWPEGQKWFLGLKARHQQGKLLSDMNNLLTQTLAGKSSEGSLSLSQEVSQYFMPSSNAPATQLPNEVIEGDLLQRSAATAAVNVAYDVSCTTSTKMTPQGLA